MVMLCGYTEFVRAQLVSAHGAIAIMAKKTKSGREALLLQPCKEAVSADSSTGLTRSFPVGMVKRQEQFLVLPAALAGDVTRSVVSKGFDTGSSQPRAGYFARTRAAAGLETAAAEFTRIEGRIRQHPSTACAGFFAKN